MVAIISLLVSVLLPSLTKAKEMARQAMCLSNLHQIGLGILSVTHNQRGSLPRTGYYTHSVVDLLYEELDLSPYSHTEEITEPYPFEDFPSWRVHYRLGNQQYTYFRNLPTKVRNRSIFRCPAQPPMVDAWELSSNCGHYSYNRELHFTQHPRKADSARISTIPSIAETAAMVCGGGRGYADNRVIEKDTELYTRNRVDTAGDFHLGGSNILAVDGHASKLWVNLDMPAWDHQIHGYQFDSDYIVDWSWQ